MCKNVKYIAATWVSDRIPPCFTHCKTGTASNCINVVPNLLLLKIAKKIVSSERGEGKEKVKIMRLKQKSI